MSDISVPANDIRTASLRFVSSGLCRSGVYGVCLGPLCRILAIIWAGVIGRLPGGLFEACGAFGSVGLFADTAAGEFGLIAPLSGAPQPMSTTAMSGKMQVRLFIIL